MSQDRMTGAGGVRHVHARWVVSGDLVLESACHLGNGDEGDRVDLPLLRDRVDGRSLLLGTSLAGALRSHACDRLLGYRVPEDIAPADHEAARVSRLFGGRRGDDDGGQSPLVVFDSLANKVAVEIRDGVALDPASGTAAEHLKFDQEVLPAGTRFPVRVELVVTDPKREADDLALLALALSGLQCGDIPLGARRSRGFGACRVHRWRVRRFDLSTRSGWLEWLASDHLAPLPDIPLNDDIVAALGASVDTSERSPTDRRHQVRIEVRLSFKGGLLVRSSGLQAASADSSHLHSGGQPILPGTSLAGALRSRALRIARVVRARQGDADRWIERLFGPRMADDRGRRLRSHASRIRVSERRVLSGQSLRVARIRVDRFTSGVVDGGLFDEEPTYGGRADATLVLRTPERGELGLVLLALKDLLSGDLPLGGSGSVGRGVVTGRAELHLPGRDDPVVLDAEAVADPATVGLLTGYVEQFHAAEAIPEGT